MDKWDTYICFVVFYVGFIGIMSMCVILADEMDQADDELRETIRNIWPLQAKKMLDLLIPRKEGVYHYICSVVWTCVYTHLCVVCEI
jgi:hypothetical protein